jgi:hypothetical protein
MGCDHDPRVIGRLAELSLDDAGEGEVADGAVPVPVLIAELREDTKRRCAGIEIRQRPEPRDACDAVPRPAAAVGVFEVVGEKTRVVLGEAERRELLEGGQAETSGSDLTMPTPCSRFV